MRHLLGMVLLIWVGMSGCAVPHYIWSQPDIDRREIHSPTLEQRILIASRDSDFKRAVVERIAAAFAQRPVYVKVTGIDDLAGEDANAYTAVVLINTAMGWTVDPAVEKFLDRFGALDSIIVLTTSDGGDVLPDLDNRKVDAISSASVKAQVRPTADRITVNLDRLIQE